MLRTQDIIVSLRPVAFEPLVFVLRRRHGQLPMLLFLVSTRLGAAGVGWDHLILIEGFAFWRLRRYEPRWRE